MTWLRAAVWQRTVSRGILHPSLIPLISIPSSLLGHMARVEPAPRLNISGVLSGGRDLFWPKNITNRDIPKNKRVNKRSWDFCLKLHANLDYPAASSSRWVMFSLWCTLTTKIISRARYKVWHLLYVYIIGGSALCSAVRCKTRTVRSTPRAVGVPRCVYVLILVSWLCHWTCVCGQLLNVC